MRLFALKLVGERVWKVPTMNPRNQIRNASYNAPVMQMSISPTGACSVRLNACCHGVVSKASSQDGTLAACSDLAVTLVFGSTHSLFVLGTFHRTVRQRHKEPQGESHMRLRSFLGAAGAAVFFAVAVPALAHDAGDKVTLNLEQTIPNIPGKSLIAVVVDYPPGGASPPHVHAKSAFIYAYVLAGAIESQVNEGPKKVYQAGESFYETPGSTHPVSRNASQTEPAKLLAVFVVDTDDKALTTPVK